MKGKPGNKKGTKCKKPMSEELKQKHRELMMGKRHPMPIEGKLKLSEIQKTKKGSLAPNWIDGRSFKPYSSSFNSQLKKEIKSRDGYICKLCGAKKEEATLSIHHIDYDKGNNNSYNLVTLCIGCNSKANRKREFYRKLFEMFIFYWHGEE